MYRCLTLAKKGIGTTRPNPSVGAVIVYNNKIIGEGFTSQYGGPHAEVNAIRSVNDSSLLQKATIYVTLEPCSHYGKTPPCADLIAKHKIPEVVIGVIDTNNLVAGKGIERLKKAGCKVHVGVLEDECREHHKRFFTVQNKKRPYIILKWAETKNGYIAPLSKLKQEPVWISNEYSKQLAHKFRAQEHAILVGTTTVIADNPKLNVRTWTGNNPIRIVLDRKLRIPEELNVFDGSMLTIVFTEKPEINQENILFEKIDFSKDIATQICEVLNKHNIQSLIIEGGRETIQTFITANLWDEAKVFIGENEFLNGVKAPVIQKKVTLEEHIKNDILRTYIND